MKATKEMTILRPVNGWKEMLQVTGVDSRSEIHRILQGWMKATDFMREQWLNTDKEKLTEDGRWCGLYKAKEKTWAVSGSFGQEPDCCIEYSR